MNILTNQVLYLLPSERRLFLEDTVGEDTEHVLDVVQDTLKPSLGVSPLRQDVLHLLAPEDLGREDGDLSREEVEPTHQLAGLKVSAIVQVTPGLDRLGHSGGQGDTHLVLHLGEPLVDPRVLGGGHWVHEHHLLALLARDARDHGAVFIQ